MLLGSRKIDVGNTSRGTIAYIDFEFQVPYYKVLATHHIQLQNTIADVMAVKTQTIINHSNCYGNVHTKKPLPMCSVHTHTHTYTLVPQNHCTF